MSHGQETNYDSIADIYLASSDEKDIIKYYERPYILSNLPELSKSTVLDLGCATGYFSKYCLDQGADVISVDASPKMVKHTNRLCENRNKSYIHDIATPFGFVEPGSVDLIICSLVIHYVENWVPLFNEFHRMLKTGGKCIISTHHPTIDYEYFNRENYFQKRLVEDTWDDFSKPIKVKFFVRPLSDTLQSVVDSDLNLVKIDEPFPLEELKKIDRKMYERLCKKPLFLFMVLEK